MPKKLSIYKGVTPNNRNSFAYNQQYPWRAQIWLKNTMVNLGDFKTEREAAIAFDKMVLSLGLNRSTNTLKSITS